MGPIQQLFALFQQAQREAEMQQRPHGGMGEQESVWSPRRGMGPRPFRDPQQEGPSPPTGGPITAMYSGGR